jgi:hypothetical protein
MKIVRASSIGTLRFVSVVMTELPLQSFQFSGLSSYNWLAAGHEFKKRESTPPGSCFM